MTVDGQNDGPSFAIRNRSTPFIEALNASVQNLPASHGTLTVSDADIGNSLVAKNVGDPTLIYSSGLLPVGHELAALTSLSALTFTYGVSNGGQRNLGTGTTLPDVAMIKSPRVLDSRMGKRDQLCESAR